MKSQLMQVFSAAFEVYIEQKDRRGDNRYESLFEKYMGERWEAPVIENKVEFPSFAELQASGSPIVSQCVRIGVFDHAPYCYTLEDGTWTGWECEMAEAIREIIYNHYEELKGLTFEWVAASIDESALPMDGSDNDDIKDILLTGLRKGSYHMVFTGTLVKYDGDVEESDYEFGHPTSNFFVSGVYSGRGELGNVPIDSAESMLKFFGENSDEKTPIRLIHTSNGGQTMISAKVGDWISKEYGGAVSDWDVHIPSIFSLIQYGDPHIYIGDTLQIMVLAMDKENFPNIQNLKLNFDAFQNYCEDEGSTPNPETEQPMRIAPFALVTT